MAERTSYQQGTPSWVDLTTADPEAARAFYGELFGWEFEVGGPETGHYTICLRRGLAAAGMGGDPAPEGMPTVWTSYLASDDVDVTAARVAEGGGSLVMEPMDVMDQGRMLIAADPTGAVFGVWQAGARHGADVVNEPGSVIWNELLTTEPAAAREFYARVFDVGWEAFDDGSGGPEYFVMGSVENAVAGATALTDEMATQHVPPHWMTCFAVAAADGAVETAQRLGGQVRVPVTDSPQGRFAVLADPQGVAFSVLEAPPEPTG